MADKVSIKIETLQKIIELVENYELTEALHILHAVSSSDYRKKIRKEKEQLYFQMRHSKDDDEYEKNRAEYESFMASSLF